MKNIVRNVQQKIETKLIPNKVVIIFGARRVGKTVLMRQIASKFTSKVLLLNGEDYDTCHAQQPQYRQLSKFTRRRYIAHHRRGAAYSRYWIQTEIDG